jgi:hypothetical protein
MFTLSCHCFIVVVVATGDKLSLLIAITWRRCQFIGVVDTGEQLFSSVVDTGDKHKAVNIYENFYNNLKWP